MKLRNKKTGEVIDFNSITDLCFDKKIQLQAIDRYNKPIYIYNSLAELNEEWEDYEEPKDGWCIDYYEAVKVSPKYEALIKEAKLIGNYFDTKEEAEKALEKLKAWKWLKDKGFRVFSTTICGDDITVNFKLTNHIDYRQSIDDFDCIFGFGGRE